MKIHLLQVPPEGLHLQGDETPHSLHCDEMDIEFIAPISHDVMATVQGKSLLVMGRLWTKLHQRCGRCLKTFDQSVEVLDFLVHRELSGEELVDLTAEVREDILLALPGYPVCNARCQGLCPMCGQDLNERQCRCRRTNVHPAFATLDEAWQARPKEKP